MKDCVWGSGNIFYIFGLEFLDDIHSLLNIHNFILVIVIHYKIVYSWYLIFRVFSQFLLAFLPTCYSPSQSNHQDPCIPTILFLHPSYSFHLSLTNIFISIIIRLQTTRNHISNNMTISLNPTKYSPRDRWQEAWLFWKNFTIFWYFSRLFIFETKEELIYDTDFLRKDVFLLSWVGNRRSSLILEGLEIYFWEIANKYIFLLWENLIIHF